jgi:hypothetical protein
MMEELKNHFIGEFGIAAWDQVLAATTQIKKDQRAAALQARKDQEEMMGNVMLWGIAFLIFLLVVALFSMAAIALLR